MAMGLLGIGAGFDLGSVLDQIMAIERKPLDQVLQRQSTVESQISSIGRLKSSFSSLETSLSSLRFDYNLLNNSVSSSDESVATATATSDVAQTDYSLDVTSLAASSKLASSSYADADTATVGSGTMTISVGSSSFDITVDAGDTLNTISSKINSAADNAGVTAGIINESGGSRLIVTGEETGASNAVTFSFADDDGNNTDASGLSRLFSFGVGGDGLAETVRAAADAQFSIDGFDMTSASNTVINAVSGMSIELQTAGTTTLSVSQDNEPVKEKLQAFVDAYNGVRSTVNAAAQGSLQGDSIISTIERSLAEVLNTAGGSGQYTHLSQIGITRDKYGTMSLDTARLDEVMNTDLDAVVSLLTDSADRIYSFANTVQTNEGFLGGREASLNSRKTYLEDQAESWQRRLEVIEARYHEKFSKLDSIVSGLQGANSFLNYQVQ